jgi:hydrogenase-4 component B
VTVLLSSPLATCLAALAGWLVIGFVALLRPGSVRFAGRTLFPLGALLGVLLAAVAGASLVSGGTERLVLPIGLPDLPFHLRLDALSSLFLVLLGASSAGISFFAAGYFRRGEGTAPGLLCLQYHLFLASMGFVLLADDAYSFMLSWEVMALSSYFLVTTQHRIAEIRSAGFLYLLIAHVGALSILLCFGVLQGGSWQFTFDAMRAAHLQPGWATAAFLLATFGFGAKAGVVPLHVWLPEAHPALFTAFYGLVFAAVQTDMKRLLAYSSIENVGLVFTAIGLSIVFAGVGMPAPAALALAAALYHCLNHAFMKSLLFLGTGSVLHATGERNLGRLGGLIHRMPWVAWLSLVGVLAIAGVPPLNGFVSEWLLLQSFLFGDQIPRSFVNMLVPMGAALVALCAALAGYVMVKFFGVIFLGQPREASLARAHDCGALERIGLTWLALGCVLLGLFPGQVAAQLALVTESLLGTAWPQAGTWWLFAPLPERQVSYGPLVLLAAVAAVVVAAVLFTRVRRSQRVRRGPAWDCGFGGLDARMQDTAEGFGQPIRNIFQSFFQIERELPAPRDREPRYRVKVSDRIWGALYQPLGAAVRRSADVVARLQHGRIAVYLLYSFVTLLVLLALVL